MDIIKDAIAHLSSELGVRVAAERPEHPDPRMVTVRRLGGGGGQFIDSPRVEVSAWAESFSAAYRLAGQAADAMFTLPAYSANVAEVTQNSFYSNIYTDGSPRWTGVYIIVSNR